MDLFFARLLRRVAVDAITLELPASVRGAIRLFERSHVKPVHQRLEMVLAANPAVARSDIELQRLRW